MIRLVIASILAFMSFTAAAESLGLPFDGRWFVIQGGDTSNVNEHMGVKARWHAVDFAKLGGTGGRALSVNEPTSPKHFFSWGETVLAPAAGEVVSVASDLPDNDLGVKDTQNPSGNHVVIRLAADRFLVLAHLQNDSVTVRAGDRVKRGQALGKCGNSGDSDFPHIHVRLQSMPTLDEGTGLAMEFSAMDVELSGKTFANVEWPVIRGLFVSPSQGVASGASRNEDAHRVSLLLRR